MKTRSRKYSNAYASLFFGQKIQFYFSSIQVDKLGTKEDIQIKDIFSNRSHTYMANSTLVCTNSLNVCTTTISPVLVKKLFRNPQEKKHHIVEKISLRLALCRVFEKV